MRYDQDTRKWQSLDHQTVGVGQLGVYSDGLMQLTSSMSADGISYPQGAGSDYNASGWLGRNKQWAKILATPNPAHQAKMLNDLRKQRKAGKITQAQYNSALANAGFPGGESSLPPHLQEGAAPELIEAASTDDKKKKMLLYGGIGLGVAALIGVTIYLIKR